MKTFIYILAITICTSSFAQEVTFEAISSFDIKGDILVGVDDFKSVYYISDNVLIKESKKQDDYQFSALQLGTIASVDIINPLKIIVFYEMSNTVVILDNTLNEITRIDFTTIANFRNISLATNAGDRKLWIFNTDLQQLEIYDWKMDKIITQFPPMETNATAIASNFNFCWVVNNQQIFKYNSYGSFIESNKIKDVSLIAQSNGNVMAITEVNLYYKKNTVKEFTSINIPDIPHKDFYLKDEILYIYTGKEVSTFKIKSAK